MDCDPVELFESGKIDQLTKWTETLDNKKLRKIIKDHRGNYDFLEYIRAILRGCRGIQGECQPHFYIFCHCLDLIHANELPAKVASDLVGILLIETDLLTGDQLAELTQRFIDIIKNGCVQSEKALGLLPKLLSSVEASERIAYGGSDMNGPEYKGHVINTLCSSKWDSRCIIHLAAVFKDVPLASDELRFVIDKITRSFTLLDLQDLPALVYQLLLLSSKGHKKIALEGVIDFFVQKDSEPGIDPDSEDLLLSSNTAEALRQTEGTVILHVTFATKLDQDLGCALVKYLRNKQQINSCSTLAPFVLALSLSLSQIPRFQQQLLEFFKANILKCYKNQLKRASSFWIRQMVGDEVDISTLVLRTVNNSVHGWDHVTQGLVDLGFTLMDSFGPRTAFGKVDQIVTSSPPGPPQFSCNLGASILLQTFKLHEIARSTILERIINRVITKATGPVSHYIGLLTDAIRSMPQTFLESLPRLRDMFDYLPLLVPRTADALLHAIQPLVKLSITLRDALILVLRKSLFSRQLESRKVGINGFLLLLKNFRVLGALPCSQSSQSFSLSQVQVDVHQPSNPAGNEALCLEIIGNLKRCFNQPHAIRSLLYEGLYGVICKNSQVCGPVLDVLAAQIDKYYEPIADVVPPIRLDSCVVVQGGDVCLVEPLAQLLACSQKILIKTSEVIAAGDEDNEDCHDLGRLHDSLAGLLKSLSRRLADCELEDFQLDKSADFSQSTSVGVKNGIFAIQLMGIYESLIEYTLLRTDEESISEETCNHILSLFSIYNKITGLLKEKTSNPAAKKGKVSTVVKHNKSLFSIHFVKFVLGILFDNSVPAQQKHLDILRDNPDFTLHVITTATHKLQEIHDFGSCDASGPGNTARLQELACSIARVLRKFYTENQRCDTVKKKAIHQNMLTACLDGLLFVYKMAALSKEIKHNLALIEGDCDGTENDGDLEILVMSHIDKFQRLINNILTSNDEMYHRKDLTGLLAIVQSLYRQLAPNNDNHRSVLHWVDDLCQQQEIDDAITSKLLLSMLLELARGDKSCLPCLREMCRDIHSKLSDIDQEVEVESRNYFGVISQQSAANTVLPLITQQTESELEDVEWLIATKKAELTHIATDPDSADSDRDDGNEKHICSHIGQIITAYHELVQTALPASAGMTSVLKVIVRVYGALLLLTKYFIGKFTATGAHPSSKFEKLVKLSGTHLTQLVYAFISYIQTVNNEKIRDGFDKGKKSKKKIEAAARAGKVQALKETKLIPCLIYTIEQYECSLIQLSKKIKIDLMQHIKLSTSRDFRINASILESHMDSDSGDSEQDEEGDENEENRTTNEDAEATPPDPTPSPPPAKKAKKRKSAL